jgi:predicted enzyme involved in methoxymalonyl-ACP biosynthesis
VSDKFGDSGVTGLSIVTINQTTETAEIDSFLMSCRVIGRNIEYAFLDYIVQKIKEKKIRILKAKYNKIQKNEQVKEFYDKCSFILTKSTGSVRHYNLDINKYEPNRLNYIEIVDEK